MGAFLSKLFILQILLGLPFFPYQVFCIRAPWTSPWKSYAALSPSPKVIPHPLNEYPAKVDVQIRVTEGTKQHIFSGFGSCQRDDDDPRDFGGIVFIYNDQEVKLYTPVDSMIYSTNLRGVFAYTGGPSFAGPFQGYYPNADVRVRVWRMCDFPPANFTSAGEYTVSTSDASITSIPHHIGYYPDFVVVQLKLSNGYISEAQGTVFKEVGEVSHNAVCGVIMAYNILDIRLWPATEGVGRVGVFCVSDGWGGNEFYTAATVYIQAWKFPPSDILFSQTDTRGPGIMVPSTLLMPQPFSIETNIFLVQSQALEGNNANYLFEAAGSALSDGSTFFGRIGAVVYAYNSEEFNLWYPGTGDFLIYVGGTWGKGDMSQSSSTASVKVKVIKTDSPLPGCGCAVCTSDWNTLTTTCDCQTLSCPVPNDIPNSYKLFDGQTTNSSTLYSCQLGFQSNKAPSLITCNGTHWETTDFDCAVAGPCITSTTVVYNITTVQQRIQELRNNLTVDTKNTSSYRRSLTCADDSRPSAAQIGYLGIGILCLTGGLVLCADLTSLAKIHEDDD